MVGIRERIATYPLPFYGKLVETASLISCTYPTTATKNACFTYHCTDKCNHFFSLYEKYGNEINCQVLVALFRYVLHAVH